MSSEVMEILAGLLKLASSEGGQSVLLKLFKGSGVTVQKVNEAIDSLPMVKDTKEVPSGKG